MVQGDNATNEVNRFDIDASQSFTDKSFIIQIENKKSLLNSKNLIIALAVVIVILSSFLIYNIYKTNDLNKQLEDQKAISLNFEMELNKLYDTLRQIQEDYKKLEQEYKESQSHKDDHSGISGIFKRIGDVFK